MVKPCYYKFTVIMLPHVCSLSSFLLSLLKTDLHVAWCMGWSSLEVLNVVENAKIVTKFNVQMFRDCALHQWNVDNVSFILNIA